MTTNFKIVLVDNKNIGVAYNPALEKGGPGSGNFGHSGRPGVAGGSGGGAGGGFAAGARRFEDGEVADAKLSSEFREWEGNITASQRYAIRRYTGTYYEEINNKLRFDIDPEEEGTRDLINNDIPNIDAALKASPGLAEDTVVYRGVAYNPKLNVGDTIMDKGFMSTSADPEIAEGFATQFEGDEEVAVFEINCAKGLRAAYVSNVGSNSVESEVLLARNTELSITNIIRRPDNKNGTRMVTVYQAEIADIYDDADLE